VSPPLDQGVVNLQAYRDLLEATNPVLDAGVADLERLGQALSATEGRLASGFRALDTEIDGVQKEAETSEATAVKACGELGSAAQEEFETELPEVERQATGAQEEWAKELDEKGRAVDAAFQELESDGWSPLDTGLESERRDFEGWAKEADAAIDRVGQAVTTLTAQVERDVTACTSALDDTAAEAFFDHAFWEPAHAQASKVDTDVVQSFGTERLEVVKSLGEAYADLVSLMDQEARRARDAMTDGADDIAAAIGDETEQATRAVDAAAVALEAGKVEFDASAIAAEAAEPRAAELVQLESGIEAANARLEEIRGVMEAMAQ
jgi:hypothetical protein